MTVFQGYQPRGQARLRSRRSLQPESDPEDFEKSFQFAPDHPNEVLGLTVDSRAKSARLGKLFLPAEEQADPSLWLCSELWNIKSK